MDLFGWLVFFGVFLVGWCLVGVFCWCFLGLASKNWPTGEPKFCIMLVYPSRVV